MNKKCSSCGGNLVFSPNECALVCEKCSGLTAIVKSSTIKKHNIEDQMISNSSKKTVTNCTSCGASINLVGLEVTGVCPYCGSSLNIGFSSIPDGVLPFKITRDEAIELYKKNVKKRAFLPNAFKKNPNYENLEGFYIPSFSFDCDTSSSYNGRLEQQHTDSKGNTHTTTFNISGNKDISFRNTFIESSSKLNQLELEEILPFDTTTGIYEFNDDYLLGYSVENFDNSLENCKVLHKNIIKAKIERTILSGYSYSRVNYLNVQTVYSNVTYSYVLVPVYSLKIKYKDKEYSTFINGQNGNLGKNLPKSKVKIAFFVLFILLIIVGIAALVYFLD